MANQEIAERIRSRPKPAEAATYANIAAKSWNIADIRALARITTERDTMGILGDLQRFDDLAGFKKKLYMKVYKPGAIAMSDEADKPKEVAKPEAASETILRGGVIKNQALQENWRETQQHHMLGQEESATDLFYKPGASKETSQKFELFDSSKEPTLLAANIVPGSPMLDQMPQYQDVHSDMTVTNIAQNYEYNGRPPTLVPSGQAIEMVTKVGLESAKHAYKYGFEHPYRGREIEHLSKISPPTWGSAYKAFPELQAIGKLDEQATTRLVKAIIANELEHYDVADRVQDYLATTAADTVSKRTIGFPQMSAIGIKGLAQELERQVAKGERTSNPLSEYAHVQISEVSKALEDPQNAPLFVAANIAHNVRMYEQNKYPITLMTLGYGFNPDLPDSSGKNNHDMLPADLSKSTHAKNIEKWLKKL
ncbi:MAG: hypothetical protein KGS72_20085 [Cyanobacteria bacterium REEB67]|nr:hypothetical protein [Cyanobacteria bacterium REEB67]